MKIYLNKEFENKYYERTITVTDIGETLMKNGFTVKNGIPYENSMLKDMIYEGKDMTECILGVDAKNNVFLDIKFDS